MPYLRGAGIVQRALSSSQTGSQQAGAFDGKVPALHGEYCTGAAPRAHDPSQGHMQKGNDGPIRKVVLHHGRPPAQTVRAGASLLPQGQVMLISGLPRKQGG